MADKSSTITQDSMLLELLAELKLEVFSNLSAKDIFRCRRVCKALHEIIDSPAHYNALCRPVRARATFNLHGTLASIFTPPTNQSFLEYLFHVISMHGIWQERRHTMYVIWQAVNIWAEHVSAPLIEHLAKLPGQPIPRELSQMLFNVACALVQTYMDTHYPPVTTRSTRGGTEASVVTRSRIYDVSSLDTFHQLIDSAVFTQHGRLDLESLNDEFDLPLDRAQLSHWYLQIRNLQEHRVTNTFGKTYIDHPALVSIPRAPHTALAIPEHILTPLHCWEQSPEILAGQPGFMLIHPGRFADAAHLANCLGVDEALFPMRGTAFAFCSRTWRSEEKVAEAIAGDRVLDEWEKVAILEDLYIA